MTIKDVAAYCGVSVSTVSRVLNSHPDVSDAVREKVLAAVEELHFIPNNAARDLVSTPANNIGLVVRGAENPFYTPLIHAIESACEQAGYTMVLHQIPVGAAEITAAAELARSKRLKGVIFLGGRFDYTQAEATAVGVPFVCCTNTNEFGDLPKDSFSSVSIDDIATAYAATRQLIERGHTRIALIIDTDHDRSISQLRLDGYCQALTDAGIAFDPELVIQTIEFTMDAAYTKVAELIERGVRFSAIFSVADTLAIAAMKALYDHGIRVPEEVSIIGIDGIEMSLYSIPTLTTMCQPAEELGVTAAKTLIGVLEGTGTHQHIRLETQMRHGGTLAAAN